jgi:hypothetical protein
MAKPIVFFPHDTNSRSDPSMQRLIMKEGMRGVGIYWSIIEMLHENYGKVKRTEIERIAFELHEEYERITNVIRNYGLFVEDEENLFSKRVDRNISDIMTKSEKARNSINERWLRESNTNERNTTVSKKNTTVSKNDTIRTEQIKEEQKKELPPEADIYPFSEFWNSYGKKVDSHKCELKWKRLTNQEKVLIKEKLESYISATPDLKFRKNPLTYLNGKLWQDEHVPIKTEKKSTFEELTAKLK